jgi:hypothetical protein
MLTTDKSTASGQIIEVGRWEQKSDLPGNLVIVDIR